MRFILCEKQFLYLNTDVDAVNAEMQMPRFPSGLINTMKLATPMILTNIFFRKDGDQSIQYCVLLNRAPTSTQLHLPPPSSTKLHPPPSSTFQPSTSSTHVHPAHFSLYPALCNTLNVIRTKILHIIGQFPQIQTEKFKVAHFD